MSRRILGAMLALALAGLVVWWWGPNSRAGDGRGAAAMRPSKGVADSTPTEISASPKRPPGAMLAKAEVGARRRSLDAVRAASLRDALVRSMAASAAHADGVGERVSPEGAPAPEPPPGTLSKEYIRSAVQEIKPLIRECYELALQEAPELHGKLVTRFSIIGDPEIGGVVENSELIADQSTVHHPTLDECVRETMYGIELPAPEQGGRVEVHYPFVFETGDEKPAQPAKASD